MSAEWPWNILSLPGPVGDERTVKKAYAQKLKQIDRQDADQFQELRQAYDAARQMAHNASDEAGLLPETSRHPNNLGVSEGTLLAEQELSSNPLMAPVEDEVRTTVATWEEFPDSNQSRNLAQSDGSPFHLDEVDADYSSLDFDEVAEIIECNIYQEKGPDQLRFFLKDIISSNSDCKNEVEDILIGALIWKISNNRYFSLSREYLVLFDEYFHWVSDGVHFLRKMEKFDRSEYLVVEVGECVDAYFRVDVPDTRFVNGVWRTPSNSLMKDFFALICRPFQNVYPAAEKHRNIFNLKVYRDYFYVRKKNPALFAREFLIVLNLVEVLVWFYAQSIFSKSEFAALFLFVVLSFSFVFVVYISSLTMSKLIIVIVRLIGVGTLLIRGPGEYLFRCDWRPEYVNWWLWIQNGILFSYFVAFGVLLGSMIGLL